MIASLITIERRFLKSTRQVSAVATVAILLFTVVMYQVNGIGGRIANPDPFAANSISQPISVMHLTLYPFLDQQTLSSMGFESAMRKCRPANRWTSMSSILHGLLLWNIPDRPAMPDNADRASENELFLRVANYRSFHKAYPDYPAFLIRTRYGARFVESTKETISTIAPAREAHWGQTLSVIGEMGLPRTYCLETRDGSATISEVVEDLVANFSLEQGPEWAIDSLAFYLPPQNHWRNKFGQEFSFDGVIEHLTQLPLGAGSSCAGTHVLYGVALILQADRNCHILTSTNHDRAVHFLARAAERLRVVQTDDGSWNPAWSGDSAVAPLYRNRLDEVWITGHHLDWMAIAPPECRVPDQQLRLAIIFVLQQVLAADDDEIVRNCCQYIHGLRAASRLARAPADNSQDGS